MKILFILNSILDFKSGCHFYRVFLPSLFMIKNGVEINYVTHEYDKTKMEELVKWADVISFSRAYRDRESLNFCIDTCKANNKRIVYDLDDDIWSIIDENPAICAKKNMEECGERLLDVADIITTTTEELANVLRKKNNNVVIVPNAIDPELFKKYKKEKEIPTVVYSGSASHWKDMLTVLPEIKEVKKSIPFNFVLLGFTAGPIESAMYEYAKLKKWNVSEDIGKYQSEALKAWEYLKRMNIIHFPFYTPELYPDVLSRMINAEIGICPLENNTFNESKSCLKFYEYGSCGTATLAPRILPYSKEVDYTYDGPNDFKTKLTKLLKDKELREEIAERQHKWVIENRNINNIVKDWIKTYEGTTSSNT